MGCKPSKTPREISGNTVFNVESVRRRKVRIGLKIGKDEYEGYEASVLAGYDRNVSEKFTPVEHDVPESVEQKHEEEE